MENRARFTGVSFNNLRKALYLMFFGVDPIYDKKGERLATLSGYIGDISSNSKKEITIETDEDLSKAYEINYTIRFNND